MSDTNVTFRLGIGKTVFVVFLILKLCSLIDWSWWWVTSPLWIAVGFYMLLRLTEQKWPHDDGATPPRNGRVTDEYLKR